MKYLLIICLLVSCQSYRAERKINKLKSWGYLSSDTIVRYDTIRGFVHDTFISFDTLHSTDTIKTVKNGIKTLTVIKWKERQVRQIPELSDILDKAVEKEVNFLVMVEDEINERLKKKGE